MRTRVSAFLRALDDQGLRPPNVNEHRHVLATMFRYACREDTHGLEINPVLTTDKRPEPPPAALDYYEFHEVQALAKVTAAGLHRHGERDDLDRRIDEQDAEFFRILFVTGLRLGEAVTLRWSDVDLESRNVLLRRGLSAGVETIPKGRRYRYVPLAAPAVEALRRLAARGEFLGPDDYVSSTSGAGGWTSRRSAGATRAPARRPDCGR